MSEVSEGDQRRSAADVKSRAEPMRFAGVAAMDGFLISPAEAGKPVAVCVAAAITSDMPLFSRVADNLRNIIERMVSDAGGHVDVRRANSVLLVYKRNGIAELWVDSVAVAFNCVVKREVAVGSGINDSDIADVIAMGFPDAGIEDGDRPIFLFREGWGFGLAVDLRWNRRENASWFNAALGMLYRTLRFRDLYNAVGDASLMGRLTDAGWFPFVEIVNSEFQDLVLTIESGFDLAEAEAKVVASFDRERLMHLRKRWATKPHFGSRAALLDEALDSFLDGRAVATIKTILTEIEGILRDARKDAGQTKQAKIADLLAFAMDSGTRRGGGVGEGMYFPANFGRYLETITFANFDPAAGGGSAGSRHAVGHGAAPQETYTIARALQAILTLDQLFFFT